MAFQLVPVKGQKFDIGRTINPFKCDCEECTFMNCPKKNYAVKMTKKIFKTIDFWEEFKEEILSINEPMRWQYSFHDKFNLELNYHLLNEFIDMLFKFPKGTYWSPEDYIGYAIDTDIDDRIYKRIAIQKISRCGNIVNLGSIEVCNGRYTDLDLSETQEKLAIKISNALKELKELVFKHYQDRDKDWKIGWLSPEGRHYPCSHTEHWMLAREISGGELALEREGWVKVALEDAELGYLFMARTMTAEQRNWLSLNGYVLED